MDNSPALDVKVIPSSAGSLSFSEPETDGASSIPTSARSSFEQVRSADSRRSSLPVEPSHSSRSRDIILKAFLPRVAVYASQDTEELIRLKGIYGGLCGLLQPFGENLSGKVGIRDSTGLSKSWDDYGVHFVRFEKERRQTHDGQIAFANIEDPIQEGDWSRILKASPEKGPSGSVLDEVIWHQLKSPANFEQAPPRLDDANLKHYNLFLRKILSERPLSPHDTFSHPVACVIAISSQTPDPISTLGDLYHDTRAESGNLPIWVNSGFLRYYLLVHDEDHDDITVSTGLFAQMKRHFGLHCHMLRLRSIECTGNEKEGSLLPTPCWLTADEDAEHLMQEQEAAPNELEQYLFDTDAAVIKSFVRELITQSIVPYMENRVTTWNDQVASRRRGVTGRLMSMSRRFAGFGSVRGRTTPASSGEKDYDSSQGAYKPESATAIMQRLADYSFMLRDWKLSSSIYDLLRSDFNDDKAWHHYAEAHEMAAISLLLMGQSGYSKGKVETINQLLDTASYSFITRCGSPREASRCMIIAMELYINDGGIGAKEAPRWGKRILELSILNPLIQVLVAERIAVGCKYRSAFLGAVLPEPPYRRAALWRLLAAETWIALERPELAKIQLEKANMVYKDAEIETAIAHFEGSEDHLVRLERLISDMGDSVIPKETTESDTFVEHIVATSENDAASASGHRHSRSTHRRGHSQSNILSTIFHDEILQEADDGFS